MLLKLYSIKDCQFYKIFGFSFLFIYNKIKEEELDEKLSAAEELLKELEDQRSDRFKESPFMETSFTDNSKKGNIFDRFQRIISG